MGISKDIKINLKPSDSAIVKEFYSEDNKLKAQIILVGYVYKVIFFKDNKLVEVKDFRNCSMEHIYNYCENYITGIPQV